MNEKPEKCRWDQEQLDSDCWNTDCGQAFCLNDGGPRENKMKFCCFCGKRLAQRKARG